MIFCGELYFCVGYIVGVMGDIRNSKITRVSIVGILTNVCLASFKAVVGLMAHSIAVILDAVNNLSDALSSVITIVGVKLAGRKPDREHPFGHGRVEYFTAIVISALVFAAGVTSFVESVKKIIKPEASDYSWITVLVITVAIVTKLILGRYVKKRGIELNSDALVASGADITFDVVIAIKYDQAAICAEISEAIQSNYPGYSLSINVDTDYSD